MKQTHVLFNARFYTHLLVVWHSNRRPAAGSSSDALLKALRWHDQSGTRRCQEQRTLCHIHSLSQSLVQLVRQYNIQIYVLGLKEILHSIQIPAHC